MSLSSVFQVIGRHKVLLVVGVLVALLAAFAAAFKVETFSLTPRVEQKYDASTQLLVSDASSMFASKTPSQMLVQGQTAAGSRDLSALTVVYAYVASGADIRAAAAKAVGGLHKGESISADQRTTQPGSDTNTGTYRLPVLEITGTATSAARAEKVSAAAAKAFQDYVTQQQTAAAVTPDALVHLTPLAHFKAKVADGTNPILPVVAIGVGVLIAFIALIFAVDNVRTSRRLSRAAPPTAVPASGAAASAPPRPAPAATQPRPVFPFATDPATYADSRRTS
jgi:capsular polysaccharide biosynthesis protein